MPEKLEDLEIKGLQFISEDGQKRFFGSFKGLFHVASDYKRSKDVIVIAEGYATARSIVQALQVAPSGSNEFPYSKVCREIEKIDSDKTGIPSDSCTHNTGAGTFPVLAAMSSINMKPVAEKIADQFPNSEIIIAADNDEAGRKAATESQKAISGKVFCTAVYPSPEFNDFNDIPISK